MYQFLDSTGNVAFGGKKFKQAQSFRNGYAGVRLTTGEWAYIDRKGSVAIRVSVPTEGGEVYNTGPVSDGFILVKIGFGYDKPGKYYFIDRTGKIAIDVQKLFPGKEIGYHGKCFGGSISGGH